MSLMETERKNLSPRTMRYRNILRLDYAMTKWSNINYVDEKHI